MSELEHCSRETMMVSVCEVIKNQCIDDAARIGGSDPAATLDEALAREQGLQGNDIPPEPKVPGTSTVSSRGKKKGADVNKRKRSFGGEQPNPDHSLKKKKVGKGTGVKAAIKPGAKDAGEGGSSDKTTRAGRVVKPSTKARG